MTNPNSISLLHFDALSAIMTLLILYVGLCVASFAGRYLQGDQRSGNFFLQLGALLIALLTMVSADHLLLFFTAWCSSNYLLVKLMIHKAQWPAAKASGLLAGKTHLLGAVAVGTAFLILATAGDTTSLRTLHQTPLSTATTTVALILLLAGAATQSAVWPFHRWLTSSLNSPTPVSAIMHAGLVNGGGFLLARFAPLYFEAPALLNLVFIIGMVTAVLGTLWKLMQNDVKRMLACSTMGQMGFMLAQCGLGLFPAAVAHLVWHGLFKAFLFLSSGGAAQEKRLDPGYPPKAGTFIAALVCGLLGSYGFAAASGKSWFAADTTSILVAVAFFAAVQFALPLLREKPFLRLFPAAFATGSLGLLYGASVAFIAHWLEPLSLMQPQPLNPVHFLGLALLAVTWAAVLFFRGRTLQAQSESLVMKAYVTALNGSQPHPQTVTAHRNHYRYQ